MRFISKSLPVLLITAAIAGAIAHSAPPETSEAKGYTIGLSMYSLRQLFKQGELQALDYPAFAKETFGITQVDVWTGAFPKGHEKDAAFFNELKARADAVDVTIFLLMANTLDAMSDDPIVLQAKAGEFHQSVDNAVLLGSTYLRIFLRAPDGDRERALNNSLRVLKPLADYAQSKRIIIAIEPGSSKWTKDGTFLIELAQRLNHPNCKLMPDFGKMLGADPYGGTIAMMPETVVVSAKTHDFKPDGTPEIFDYPRLMKSIREAGFTGIVAIEYEGGNLGPVEGVRATKVLLESLNTTAP